MIHGHLIITHEKKKSYLHIKLLLASSHAHNIQSHLMLTKVCPGFET